MNSKTKKSRSILALMMIIVLVLTMGIPLVTCAASVTLSDIKGFWAEKEINAWVGQGFIDGYPDGTFKPDNQITRAEFIALVNRVFKFTGTAPVTFKDVSQKNWFYKDVAKAEKAGYLSDLKDGSFVLKGKMVRQEVAAIICRLMKLNPSEADTNGYSDVKDIPSAFKGFVGAVTKAGYMEGASGKFSPKDMLTRAQAVKALDNLIRISLGKLADQKVYTGSSVNVYVPAKPSDAALTVKSSDESVVTASINGSYINLKGIKTGSATITVSGKKSGYFDGEASFKATVETAPASSTPSSPSTPSTPTNNAPVITVNEPDGVNDGKINLKQGDTFVPPTVTASDAEDGNITSRIVKTGESAVDTSKVGEYTLTYSVKDSQNATAAKTVTVKVVEAIETANITVDVTAIPSIVLVTVNSASVGSRFKVEGTDPEEFGKPIEVYVPTGDTKVVSILDAVGRVIGTITVNVKADSTKDYTFHKVEILEATANITVDVTAIPSIVYITVNSASVGSKFKAEGTAPEVFGKSVEVFVNTGDTKDVSILDANGNVIGIITVNVKADSTKDYSFIPVELTDATANITVDVTAIPSIVYITVNNASVGNKFKVEGTDPEDIGKSVEVFVSAGDTKVVSILDADGKVLGNISVNVKSDSTKDYTFQVAGSVNRKPVITLVEPDGVADGIITLEKGHEFVEPTATASDPEDGDITGSIEKTGSVDTSAVGEYTLKYSVSDSKGLMDERTVLVKVVAPPTPGEKKANIKVNVLELFPTFVYITVNSATEGTQFKVQNSNKVMPIGQTIKTVIDSGDTLTVTILDAGSNVVGTTTVSKLVDSTQDYTLN